MELKLTVGFDQLLNLVNQLSEAEKKRLLETLQDSADVEEGSRRVERQLGKYEDQIWMADDFNEPLEEFKDYM